MFCEKCGKQINEGDVFCAFCGETIHKGDKAAIPAYPAVPPPVQPVQNFIHPFQRPVPAAEPPKKSGKGLVIAIAVLAVLLAAALAVVIFMLVKNAEDSDDSSSDKSVSAVSTEAASAELTTEPAVTTLPEVPAEVEVITVTFTTAAEEVVTTTETEPAPPETTTAQSDGISDDAAARSEAMFYSTYELPTFADFDWCYGQYSLLTSPPPNAEMIENPLALDGGWKAMLIYDFDSSYGDFMREVNNFSIMIDGSTASVSIDWYYVEVPYSEPYVVDDDVVTLLTGTVSGSTIEASGDVTVTLDKFWRDEEKQYGLGTMYAQDGMVIYVALVRK